MGGSRVLKHFEIKRTPPGHVVIIQKYHPNTESRCDVLSGHFSNVSFSNFAMLISPYCGAQSLHIEVLTFWMNHSPLSKQSLLFKYNSMIGSSYMGYLPITSLTACNPLV